jgi:hypothetical protein
MSNTPNDDDLLLFDVIQLIKAYEEGLFKNIQQDPAEGKILTGYQSPLTGIEATLELSLLSADTSMTDVINSITTQSSALTVNDGGESAPEEKKPTHLFGPFYTECSLTDKNGEPTEEWWNPQDSVTNQNFDFTGEKPVEYDYRKTFTNEYKAKLSGKVTKYLEDHAPVYKIGDKNYKLDIENCLNCMVDINVELTLPSLEFVFNLTKFLKSIQDMLRQMVQAMDPTLLYDALCKFLLNFGPNVMCPANLIGLNLLLPTLFIKYTLDLGKLRFDWTGLFGGMVKAVLNFIVQLVEAIPKIVNPVADCIVSAFRTIMNMLRALVASGEKLTNEAIDAVNQVGYAIQKVTPTSFFSKESEDLQKEYDELAADIDWEAHEARNKPALLRYRGMSREEIKRFASWVYQVNHYSVDAVATQPPISFQALTGFLLEYLTLPGNEKLREYLESESEATAAQKLYDKESATLSAEYNKKIAAAKRKETLDDKKDFFNFDFVAETKTITTPFFEKLRKPDKRMNLDLTPGGAVPIIGPVTARDVSREKSKWNAVDYAFAKYGIDIRNEYRQPKDLIDYKAANWVGALNQTDTFQFIEKIIIGSVLTTKKWINEEVAKITQTLKALQTFMGEVASSEFKILGDMLALAHLIRFVKLIIKFLDEGLSCENVRENKSVVENILEENNQRIQVQRTSDSINFNGKNLDADDYIKVKSLDTNGITIIDLTECSDLSAILDVNKDSLDSIYEGILHGIHTS